MKIYFLNAPSWVTDFESGMRWLRENPDARCQSTGTREEFDALTRNLSVASKAHALANYTFTDSQMQ